MAKQLFTPKEKENIRRAAHRIEAVRDSVLRKLQGKTIGEVADEYGNGQTTIVMALNKIHEYFGVIAVEVGRAEANAIDSVLRSKENEPRQT